MKTAVTTDLEPYLAQLRKLPFVTGAEVELRLRQTGRSQADALVRLRTPRGERTLWAEVKRTHVTRPLVDGLLARTPMDFRTKWILFAPYIGAEIGRHLRENGTNYIDAAGNCFLAIKQDYIANVEANRKEGSN